MCATTSPSVAVCGGGAMHALCPRRSISQQPTKERRLAQLMQVKSALRKLVRLIRAESCAVRWSGVAISAFTEGHCHMNKYRRLKMLAVAGAAVFALSLPSIAAGYQDAARVTSAAKPAGSVPIILAQRRDGDSNRGDGDRGGPRSDNRGGGDRSGARSDNRGGDRDRPESRPNSWRGYGNRGRRYRDNRPGWLFWAPWVGGYVYFDNYNTCYNSCDRRCIALGDSRRFCDSYCTDLCAW